MGLKEDVKAVLEQGVRTGQNLSEARSKVDAAFALLKSGNDAQKTVIAALEAKILELEAGGSVDPADIEALKALHAELESGVQSVEDAAEAELALPPPPPPPPAPVNA